jgi:hypothetical protein
MPVGGEVVLVCDYEALAHDMCGHFDTPEMCLAFDRTPPRAPAGEDLQWLAQHPLPAKSEREVVCEIKWRDVYRVVYTRR